MQQPPTQGKAAIDAISATVASTYFPKVVSEAKALLLEGPLAKASAVLVRGAVDRLLYGIFEVGSPHRMKGSAIVALQAILELKRADAEERIHSQIKKIAANATDADMAALAVLVSRVPEAWEGLPSAQQTKVQNYILSGPGAEIARVLRASLGSNHLKAIASSRLKNLTAEELASAIKAAPMQEYVPRAIELFTSAMTWAAANKISESIVLPLVEYIHPSDVEEIVKSPREKKNDLRHSAGLERFLNEVTQKKIVPLDSLNTLLEAEGFDPRAVVEDGELPTGSPVDLP